MLFAEGELTGASVRTDKDISRWRWCGKWSRCTILSTRASNSRSVTCRCREGAAAGNGEADTLLANKCKYQKEKEMRVSLWEDNESVDGRDQSKRRRAGRRVCIKFLICRQRTQSTDRPFGPSRNTPSSSRAVELRPGACLSPTMPKTALAPNRTLHHRPSTTIDHPCPHSPGRGTDVSGAAKVPSEASSIT